MGGANGSEVALTSEMYLSGSATEAFTQQDIGYTTPLTGLNVPAGTRLTVQTAAANASEQTDWVMIAYTR
jgi:hypothetical protein